MKAMILAAGEGRRMHPLTLATPKPLLQVQGVSLIEHQIARLKNAGICDLVVNVAYLGEQIEAALGTGESLGVRVRYSREPEPLETAGALLHALPLLGDAPFVLVNGDVWTDYPFEALAQWPLSGLGHLVMVPNPAFRATGDFALATDGLLHPRQTDAGLTFSGISLLSPQLIVDYPNKRPVFPLLEVFNWAMADARLSGELYTGVWSDVGTPERLWQLNENGMPS